MAQVTDPYAVLGVSRDADKETIKKAYRKLAKKYHPDTHPNDPVAAEKMNEINQAYDMLTDPDKYSRSTGPSTGSYTYGNPFGYGNYGYGNYRNGTYGNSSQNYSSGTSGNGSRNYKEYRNFWEMYDDVFEKNSTDSRQFQEFQERLRREQQRAEQQSRRKLSLGRLIWRGFWFFIVLQYLLRACAPVDYYYYDPYGYQDPYYYEEQIQEVPGNGNGNGNANGNGYDPYRPEGAL